MDWIRQTTELYWGGKFPSMTEEKAACMEYIKRAKDSNDREPTVSEMFLAGVMFERTKP